MDKPGEEGAGDGARPAERAGGGAGAGRSDIGRGGLESLLNPESGTGRWQTKVGEEEPPWAVH